MAEFVLKAMVKEAGVADDYEIASAAVSPEEWGNNIYPPAQRQLRQHGIPFSPRSARVITKEDAAYYDYIIAMDQSNLRGIQRICGSAAMEKTSLLLDYTNHPQDVDDPWYSGDFTQTWDDIASGCRGILKTLEQEKTRR